MTSDPKRVSSLWAFAAGVWVGVMLGALTSGLLLLYLIGETSP